MKNRNAFTLIELLAVIVILGILVLVAVPAVTRYIDESKKRTYVTTIKNITDTVRYGVASGDSRYEVKPGESKSFQFKDIETEKGKITKSPYGDFNDSLSYVLVTNNNGNYTYKVQAKDSGNYAIPLTDIDEFNADKVKLFDELTETEKMSFPEYEIYSVGDTITFGNASWRVIKNSPAYQDYVTIIKELLLTADEIGDDYAYKTDGNSSSTMAYYWSDTCHWRGSYGTYTYNNYDDSGCNRHSDYDGSKIKEALDAYMQRKLDISKLKEINGYRIRLLTRDEMINDLGYNPNNLSNGMMVAKDNVPIWVYQEFCATQDCSYCYWIMPSSGLDYSLFISSSSGALVRASLPDYRGVRPVINLLKSAIKKNSH